MNGLHLTADLRECASRVDLRDPAALRTLIEDTVAAVGLHPVSQVFHRFPAGGGVTGVVLLAESHVAIHTWPELRALTLDTYVCNVGRDNSARAHTLMEALIAVFAPAAIERHTIERGALGRVINQEALTRVPPD